jgi:hypothetical protein
MRKTDGVYQVGGARNLIMERARAIARRNRIDPPLANDAAGALLIGIGIAIVLLWTAVATGVV